MENKKTIRTFCGCKPYKKKNNIEPHQNFTGYYNWLIFIILNITGSDYCVNDTFPGTFAGFRLKIFTKEKISSYGDPCP